MKVEILDLRRRRRSVQHGTAAAISVAAHLTVIVLLVAGPPRVREQQNQFRTYLAQYLAPPAQVDSHASERIQLAFIGGGSGTSPSVESAHSAERSRPTELAPPPASPPPSDSVLDQREMAAAEHAFNAVEVDSAAVRDPSSAAPAYPQDLQARGIEGHVAIRFVVDSTGLVDLSTILTVDATHPGFTKAVRDALPHMLFRPALMGSRPVRQLAEQTFSFRIVRATRETERAGPGPKRP